MAEIRYLKLGGSLITDKTQAETVRYDVLNRLSAEIRAALNADIELPLLLGHGSGSFGHVAAAKYGTRDGVIDVAQWLGFAEVSDAATRLTHIVRKSLRDADVPAIAFSPSASVLCRDGVIESLSTTAILRALRHDLVPIIHGDVAFDTVRGGTIVSTEEVMSFCAPYIPPRWLLLAGETEGVYDLDGKIIPRISNATLPDVIPALGGSRGTDVTGGMLSKVKGMLSLAQSIEGLSIRIFSGLQPGLLETLLINPAEEIGTLIEA